MKIHELGKDPGRLQQRKRVGRGEGSGHGKTSGGGHKGSQARSGRGKGYGGSFEGGQMPLHRRLPKRGFKAPFAKFNAEVRLSDLQRLPIDEIDLLALKQAGIVAELTRAAKVIKSGEITRKVTLRGLGVTAGAKAAIEAAGGSVVVDAPAAA